MLRTHKVLCSQKTQIPGSMLENHPSNHVFGKILENLGELRNLQLNLQNLDLEKSTIVWPTTGHVFHHKQMNWCGKRGERRMECEEGNKNNKYKFSWEKRVPNCHLGQLRCSMVNPEHPGYSPSPFVCLIGRFRTNIDWNLGCLDLGTEEFWYSLTLPEET